MIVYTDGFRAYEPLDEDGTLDKQFVVHGEGEYANGDMYVNTCESHVLLARSGSRLIKASPKTNPHSTSERYSFGSASAVDLATKRSKQSSKQRHDVTNNPLPLSDSILS